MRWLLKRWWFWAGTMGTVLLALFAVGCVLAATEEQVISQATCDKIQLGMTVQEMEILLQGAAASYHGDVLGPDGEMLQPNLKASYTDEDGNTIIVNADSSFRVTAKRFSPTGHSFLELMKRRIERRIRAIWR